MINGEGRKLLLVAAYSNQFIGKHKEEISIIFWVQIDFLLGIVLESEKLHDVRSQKYCYLVF